MQRQGVRGVSTAKNRFTTHADPSHVRASDLVNEAFSATRPDQLMLADFTYCSTWSGVVYVSFIIDVFSRRLVGRKASRSMTTGLVVDTLNMAAWTRCHTTLENLIGHTDAGSHYTSVLYTDRTSEIVAAASIGTVGDCYGNAVAESPMGIFKTELHRNLDVVADNGGHEKELDDLEIATCGLGILVQRGATPWRARLLDAKRSRGARSCQELGQDSMRDPSEGVTTTVRPIHFSELLGVAGARQADCRSWLACAMTTMAERVQFRTL